MDPCEGVEEAEGGMETPETPEREMDFMCNAGCMMQSSAPATSRSEPTGSDPPYPATKPTDFCIPPSSVSVSPVGTAVSTEKEGSPCASQVFTADTDCPVCFDPYSLHRLPKLLSCRHVFCAVCLKLLVWKEANAWRIICPICREATTLMGGLVCTLDTQDVALHGALAKRGLNSGQPAGPEVPSPKQPGRGVSFLYQDGGGGTIGENRIAAKRLLFLLLLLMLLGLFVLLFLYRGLLKWALCVAIGCGVVISGVLCWNPAWKCSSSGTLLSSWRKRESYLMPIA